MKRLALNAMIAALYAGIALWLPSTAFANYRLSTAMYVLAAWNPSLIPGLALGNALAGMPNGFVDVLMGGVVGLLTAWAAWRLGERWAWVAVLLVPTAVVPTWLSSMFGAPYLVVAFAVLQGQVVSAVLGWVILRTKRIKRLVA